MTYLYNRWKEKSRLETSLDELKLSMELMDRNIKNEISHIVQAQAAELRNTIRNSCKHHIKIGWITLDEKQDIMACHEAYQRIVTSFGIPNGVTEDIFNQMRELPNYEPTDKKK